MKKEKYKNTNFIKHKHAISISVTYFTKYVLYHITENLLIFTSSIMDTYAQTAFFFIINW